MLYIGIPKYYQVIFRWIRTQLGVSLLSLRHVVCCYYWCLLGVLRLLLPVRRGTYLGFTWAGRLIKGNLPVEAGIQVCTAWGSRDGWCGMAAQLYCVVQCTPLAWDHAKGCCSSTPPTLLAEVLLLNQLPT